MLVDGCRLLFVVDGCRLLFVVVVVVIVIIVIVLVDGCYVPPVQITEIERAFLKGSCLILLQSR